MIFMLVMLLIVAPKEVTSPYAIQGPGRAKARKRRPQPRMLYFGLATLNLQVPVWLRHYAACSLEASCFPGCVAQNQQPLTQLTHRESRSTILLKESRLHALRIPVDGIGSHLREQLHAPTPSATDQSDFGAKLPTSPDFRRSRGMAESCS